MPFFPKWWAIVTDPKIKQAAIDSHKTQIAQLKAMLTTPDYTATILDSEANSIPWNDATKALVQAEITALEQKIADLG